MIFTVDGSFESPAASIVNTILNKACMLNASDIHLEPSKDKVRVRYRIDGILYEQSPIEEEYSLQVLSRIKVIAHTDVAEYRIPQDGKFLFTYGDNSIDCRVATFPSLYGEKIVIRLLDRAIKNRALDALGLSPQMVHYFKVLAQKAYGFFLVTGPTGSGKTTTLHALLACMNIAEKNIVTLEDPIEYYVDGIVQTQVNPEIGFTFETGIRALMRQDPDVIMVGEIRDKETAQAAIQAALTGHLVISTLHTTSAVGSLIRLLDMNIEPFLLNATLNSVVAQRLARKLCVHCCVLAVCSPEEKAFLDQYNIKITEQYRSVGCEECHFIGYNGRIGIFELLIVAHELRSLVHKYSTYDMLYAQARADGMVSLVEDGAAKIIQGIISVRELMRVLL